MPALLNIAKTDAKPLFIDPADVTAVHYNPKEDELSIYNSKGRLLWVKASEWNLDVADVVKKLADNGAPLVSFPMHWPDDAVVYQHYISPAAVTFATVTTPEDDGKIGAIVGVEGVGREESYGITPAELDALVKAVRAVKPQLLEYAPEEASSRWYNPAALYIDPKSVTQIRDDEFQVVLEFKEVGSLDIHVNDVDSNGLVDQKAARIAFDAKDAGAVNAVFVKAQKAAKEMEKQARFAVIKDIVSANDTLIDISSSGRAMYISREDVGYVSFQEDKKRGAYYLSIRSQPTPREQYGDSIVIPFNTAAERQKAFRALTAALAPTPAPKKPKSPPRNPSHRGH